MLEKQLAWYKSFFDNATDAVFMVQPESWSILDANDYAAVLLNTEKNELIGSILPQFRRIFKLLKKSSSPSVLSELTLDKPDGSSIMVEVSARFMKYHDQKLIQAIARDVSEQHALTDKLVQADKLVLLGQLSAGVAHEIRNPLAAVNLNLQMLKRNMNEDSPNQSYLRTALQGVDRISRIVEVTLNFSRPTVADIKEINLNLLLPAALELVSSMLKRKEIRIELDFDDKLPAVPADYKQMQQVFINLITNAADAIKTGGSIKIKSYLEHTGGPKGGNFAVVAIQDSGCGIQPEDLPKIFNPFFTRKAEGTGLGLPITQRILYNHNGIIDVESATGKGTTFYVKLPLPDNN
ncbi:MAG: two-component system sensor histidine kinase NtrB [Candidatus Kapaibacterium sp.]